MNLIELREKRLEVWNKAKAFLDSHRKDGVLSAEDDAAYSRMEKELDDLGKEIIRQETRAIVDKCFELGNGDIALGICRGVASGALDVPFAPCRFNAGQMLPARDNNGAVRILNFGNLPFSKELKDFHMAKI